jgi:hypothetical protein
LSNSELLKKVSTVRLTLRLQSDLVDYIKRYAPKKDLTINGMITNILSKNVAYDETIDVIPNIILPHDLFFALVSKLKESDVEEIAKEGPKVIKKIFDIVGLQYDIDHVINDYFVILAKHCKWFEFTYKVTGDRYRLVFCTGMNSKWVTFLQHYLRAIIESFNILITKESNHAGIIVFEFLHKDYH